uniref:Uncharacterized protein n=1 Tax=Pygocentrus nattereri TaxID=42514 RepID=A0A3B4CMW8_PYGNA
MDALKVLNIVFVVLHVADAALIPCAWTQFRLRDLNEESIMLLEKMGALMPLRCLEERSVAVVQNEDLAVVVLETLRVVDRLFKNEQSSITWDRETLALFKNIISSRGVKNLQKCVSCMRLTDRRRVLTLMWWCVSGVLCWYEWMRHSSSVKEFLHSCVPQRTSTEQVSSVLGNKVGVSNRVDSENSSSTAVSGQCHCSAENDTCSGGPVGF